MENKDKYNLVGLIFGRLTVVALNGRAKDGSKLWDCCCSCGNRKGATSSELVSLHTKSCGCLDMEHIKNLKRTHGMSKTKIYATWLSMRDRCFKKTNRDYKHYGARGITVCDRWKNSFENFFSDMGERPEGKEIDRIDNNSGYSKENCRWVTHKENCNNRRKRRVVWLAN